LVEAGAKQNPRHFLGFALRARYANVPQPNLHGNPFFGWAKVLLEKLGFFFVLLFWALLNESMIYL